MKILITGGSGFIGSRLIAHLRNHHQITVLTRNQRQALQRIGFDIHTLSSLDELANLNQFDAVINLAGEPIACRWNERQKQRITHSRWHTTEKLVHLWRQSSKPPQVLISGSAVGYYGRQGNNVIDEGFANPHDEFSHQICQRWEALALSLAGEARVCILRTGIVLGHGGGALARMLPAFKTGLGGPLGDGRQYMSWIHIDDMIKAIRFLLEREQAEGIYNLTAPHPVTNAEFTHTLGKSLKRPAEFRLPEWLLRWLFGEMAELLIYGQRVIPKRLLQAGFHFSYPHLDEALKQIANSKR